MNNISAKIIEHSKNVQGDEVITFELIFPRIILSELSKHRMSALSCSSSRAVSISKSIDLVDKDPFIPIAWGKTHKGMQSNEYFEDEETIQNRINDWLEAKNNVVNIARRLEHSGVTKQIINRLFEPFMWCKAIMTIGKEELLNLFEQRCPKYEIDDNDFIYLYNY